MEPPEPQKAPTPKSHAPVPSKVKPNSPKVVKALSKPVNTAKTISQTTIIINPEQLRTSALPQTKPTNIISQDRSPAKCVLLKDHQFETTASPHKHYKTPKQPKFHT